MRWWTDIDGNRIEARLTEVFAGFAHLRSSSGQPFLTPVPRLSAEDQQYIKQVSADTIARRQHNDAHRNDSNASLVQLRILAAALGNSYQKHGRYPPAYSTTRQMKPLLSWRVHLLPYLGAGDLYRLFKLDQPWDSDYNRRLLAFMPSFYRATGSRASEGKTNFLAVRSKHSLIAAPTRPYNGSYSVGPQLAPAQNPPIDHGPPGGDEASNRAILVEVPDSAAIEWTRPDDWQYEGGASPQQLFGFRKGGFYAVMADGNVKLVSEQAEAESVVRFFDDSDGRINEPR
jgi:hypothetical protein